MHKKDRKEKKLFRNRKETAGDRMKKERSLWPEE